MRLTASSHLLLSAALGSSVSCSGERGINDQLMGVSASAGADGADDGEDDADDGDDGEDDAADDREDDDDDDMSDDGEPGGPKLDVGHAGCDAGDCGGCFPPAHEPCDGDDASLDHALGLGCEGEATVTVTRSGHPEAVAVSAGVGSTDEWSPVEGERLIVIGTGLAASLLSPDPDSEWIACSDDLGDEHAPGAELPAPIRLDPVDCEADPNLIGAGDCSSTVGEQFAQGGDAHDYTEVRVDMTVPETVSSVSYSFAFLSTEWPVFVGGDYNDMFVAWLESESWTGNVSFDENGAPISVNAGFLDHQDELSDMPQFEGTCMAGHAATKWLQTTAPVTAGEEISLVFAVFDMSDSMFDSFALIDNVEFGCEGGAPETTPAG